ncbi:MAG: hypothetical protein ACAI44_15460 [Candidatus Sericytochromatia bacterium]
MKLNLTLFAFLLLAACQPATPTPSPRPSSPAPVRTPNPAPSSPSGPANISYALPEQLSDAIRLYECYTAKVTDPDSKAYLQSNLNVMRNYTQERWSQVRANDPEGVNTREFGEARQSACQ